MTPPKMLRIVPFGDFPLLRKFLHRASSGVIVAFHSDAMLFDGVSRVDRHLIIGGVAILNREIIIKEIDVEIGPNELFFDGGPDDAVISSPSSSTTGLATSIFRMRRLLCRAHSVG
jgi:hypothetical protein